MAGNPDFSTRIISQILNEALDACLDAGMQCPLIVIAASGNGSVIVARLSGKPEDPAEFLAEHLVPEGLRAPVHLFVIDQEDGAMHSTITPDELLAMSTAGPTQ
jgi:hypothetical protein